MSKIKVSKERDNLKEGFCRLSQVYQGHLSREYMERLCNVTTLIGVPKPTEKEQACIGGASQRAKDEVKAVTDK